MSFIKQVFTLGKDRYYEEAIGLYNRHQFKEAIVKFEEILERKTSTTSLHYNLSRVYLSQSHRNLGIISFAMGNFSVALQEFEKAFLFNPDFIELHHFIGVCRNNLGDFEGAIKSFSAMLDVEPSNLPTRLKLGVAFHNLGMWDKVISLYQRILKTNPNYADIHYRLGLAYLGQGSFADAIAAFAKALGINPNYLQARIKISLTHAYLANYEEALKELAIVEKSFPQYADIQYHMGIIYTGCNRPEEAIRHFKRALEINPQYKNAMAKLGFLYCHLGEVDNCIRELEEASSIDPEDQDLVMAVKALKAARADSRPEKGLAPDILDRILGKEGEIVRTMHEFVKHIEIGPDVSEIVSTIMSASEEDSSLCEALIPLVKEHIAQHPDYPDLHDSLGTLYIRTNRFEEAALSFGEAVRLNPGYVNAPPGPFLHPESPRQTRGSAFPRGSSSCRRTCPILISTAPWARYAFPFPGTGEALKSALRTLELNPQYARAHLLLAQVYEKRREPERSPGGA